MLNRTQLLSDAKLFVLKDSISVFFLPVKIVLKAFALEFLKPFSVSSSLILRKLCLSINSRSTSLFNCSTLSNGFAITPRLLREIRSSEPI